MYLNEKKKQRSHMNDCFKHGEVLYADQPWLIKTSSYDARQTSLLYFLVAVLPDLRVHKLQYHSYYFDLIDQ